MARALGNRWSGSELAARLASPPRRVPISLATRVLLGGGALFAWLWFAIGSSIATVFVLNSDLTSWVVFRGELVSVSGVSTGCSDTGASVGGSRGRRGTPIYANRYRLGADEGAVEGVSYATGRCLAAGTPVSVEHPAGRPEVSRIAGMRRAEFGPEVAFALVFPVVGIVLVVLSLRSGRRQLRLLREGKLALGTLLGKEPTSFLVNKRRVMKLRFAIETDRGARHEVVVRTHLTEQVEDDPRERILYDPERPGEAVAWDLLPGAPQIDGTGALEPKGLLGTLLVLVPPALAIAGHALALTLAR
jgi:hypothetical protein